MCQFNIFMCIYSTAIFNVTCGAGEVYLLSVSYSTHAVHIHSFAVVVVVLLYQSRQ